MTKVKKITLTKKISNRDFANLLYFLETGEQKEPDLSAYDSATLAIIEKRSIRVTADQKLQVDKFFENKPMGTSFKSFLDSLQKKNGGPNVR